MFDRIKIFCATLLLAVLVVLGAESGAGAQDAVWRVSKSSGDASVTTLEGDQAALAVGAVLKPGDFIRTGQSGRVLLVRGEETILISPNSSVGIPAQKKSELSATIIQQAGSILLEIEKRNVKHFSVETPYLAAVVKGTQFRVTVNNTNSRVDVVKGQVEVMELKSGKYAVVQPGQAAQVSAQGTGGLSLNGSGALSPIQQGTPRGALVTAMLMSKDGAPAAPALASPSSVAVLAPAPVVQWAPAAPPSDSSWSTYFSSMGKGGKRSAQEDIALTVGLSIAIGLAFAIIVGANRRRKSRKHSQS